uniref:Uncharacterized protein n=1 Tax=Oryza nivara TaxID=4536 RepID=A0A0E0IC71_ORYNI
MTRSRPTPPARWGRPLDRGAAADQPPVAKLSPPPIRAPRHCSHLENRAVRPRQPRRRCPGLPFMVHVEDILMM